MLQSVEPVLECPGGVDVLAEGRRRVVILWRIGRWLEKVERMTRLGAPSEVVWPLLRIVERLEKELTK